MDKYTKTINELKKEYKQLQKNKNQNIKGGFFYLDPSSKEELVDNFKENFYYDNNVVPLHKDNSYSIMNFMVFTDTDFK